MFTMKYQPLTHSDLIVSWQPQQEQYEIPPTRLGA